MCKKIISDGAPDCSLLNGNRLSTFRRECGIPAPSHVVSYLYFVWLCSQVGLNGPDPTQQHRMPETEDKTYFMLGLKLHNTQYKVLTHMDENRVEDGRHLRERFMLLNSSFVDYSVLDKPGASMLEVLVALVQKFDTQVMMTEESGDRSKQWFWEMMRNANLDIFVDAGFTEIDNNANEICDSIITFLNNRMYDDDGIGSFFPLKKAKKGQKKGQKGQKTREIWLQMHAYFLENHIE